MPEAEADYVGMYILANAGYEYANASDLWRRMSQKDPDAIWLSTTHPSNPERYVALPRHNFIDEIAQANFQRLGLLPSAPCSDAEFLRRASLDLAGLLPEPDTTRQFLSDRSPSMRNALVEQLLADDVESDDIRQLLYFLVDTILSDEEDKDPRESLPKPTQVLVPLPVTSA